MGSCESTCGCTHRENELNFKHIRSASHSTFTSANFVQQMTLSEQDLAGRYGFKSTAQNIEKVRIIQNKVRAVIQRRYFLDLIDSFKEAERLVKPLYFTREEHDETLRKGKKIGKKVEVEKRKPYKYTCSKAIYDGEWIGGMRHGQGKM